MTPSMDTPPLSDSEQLALALVRIAEQDQEIIRLVTALRRLPTQCQERCWLATKLNPVGCNGKASR